MQAVSGVFAGSGSAAIMWLIILVILVVVELATMGLTTIWFAGGSLVAFWRQCCMQDFQYRLYCFLEYLLCYCFLPVLSH